MSADTIHQLEEFKRRIQAMCEGVLLCKKLPETRHIHVLWITDDKVALGDQTLTLTPEEMNEIFRFIIKERFL